MKGCFSSVGFAWGTPVKFKVPISCADKPIPPSSSAAPIPFHSNSNSNSNSNSDDISISISNSLPLLNPSRSSSRREAIGFALSLGLFGFPWELHSQRCSAAEAPPLELTLAPSGLAFCDKVIGSGPEVVKGQLIKVNYVGKLENGKVFDSSYNRGKPLTFRIGVGEVIKGWDEGILGGDGVPPMLAGGKRILKIPAELGYGMRGAGCRGGSCIIPPGSVLLFDVEFIGKA